MRTNQINISRNLFHEINKGITMPICEHKSWSFSLCMNNGSGGSYVPLGLIE